MIMQRRPQQKKDLLFVCSVLLLLFTNSAESIVFRVVQQRSSRLKGTLSSSNSRRGKATPATSSRRQPLWLQPSRGGGAAGVDQRNRINRGIASTVVLNASLSSKDSSAHSAISSRRAADKTASRTRLWSFLGSFPTRLHRRNRRLQQPTTEAPEEDRLERLRGPSVTKQALYEELERIQSENMRLRVNLESLEAENDRLLLEKEASSLMGLETFEGERQIRKAKAAAAAATSAAAATAAMQNVTAGTTSVTTTATQQVEGSAFRPETSMSVSTTTTSSWNGNVEEDALWCDVLDDDSVCPTEPSVSFGQALRDRAYWLVGLLILQSCSGIILSRNEALLANHPVIIFYLTMLVGAGGNGGNQASVRVIRGLALGTLNEKTVWQFMTRELKMAASLSAILSVVGFLRASVFRTPLPETIAVTAALALIVFSSVCLGAVLPLLLQRLGVDPAHSSTSIQVIMDILGVVLTVAVSSVLLDSPLGSFLMSVLT